MDILIDEWWAQIIKERKCSSTSKTVKTILAYPRVVQEKSIEYISKHIREGILEVRESKDINKTVDLCAAINGCFDNFSYASDAADVAFNDIINFIDVTIDECKQMLPIRDNVQMKKVKWLELIHYLARILVLVLKLRRPLKLKRIFRFISGIVPYDKKVLLGLSYKLSYFFKVKEILIDTKCTLAMASLLIREILVQDKAKLIEFHKSFLETLPIVIEEKDYELNVNRFLLGNAILNTWSGTLIDATSTETYLRFFIQLCESYSSDTGIILNISRTLLLLIKNKCFTQFMNNMYRVEFDLVNPLLSCVYMLLDHPVPCVRHSSKDFPKLLANYKEFQLSMMESLPKMLTDNRSYFICLSALANTVGSQPLVADNESLKENLFSAVRDPSMVTYVIDALHAIILKDYLSESEFSVWCERWIVPLLFCLHKVRPMAAPEIEKLLQSLLIKYPKTISFIIGKWHTPKNDEELRYIMTALKVYNKLSSKHQKESCFGLTSETLSDPKEEKWKGIISEGLLLRCLNHNDDDVRVSAFALLVETLKSTELFTRQDFDLIKYSLKYNLNNHQPATRQKFLSLVRKMMARYNDGLAVLQKKVEEKPESDARLDICTYVSFRQWLFEFSFSNIYQNANFNRLHTILSILLDYVDIIKDVNFIVISPDDCLRRLLVPLRSSYEENKRAAVLLAKKLKVLELYKNYKIIRIIFGHAFELCGKIEPPNVLTGAYLMQFLLQYPSLDKALRTYSEGISSCSMEQLVIVLLSNKLEEQIGRAEKNLIQAVTDNPMYGTLFAIRLILQETDFTRVIDTPESEDREEVKRSWSEVLRRLIGFSFRMIKVVSCVVNSSSPEGHLPSDFQTNLDLAFHKSQESSGEEDEEAAERNLGGTTSGIRRIELSKSKLPRTRSVVIEDCDRVITYYNNVFLSHGESRSFTEKNAMVFEHILTESTKLISELEAIDVPSDEESKCLTCLKIVEARVKNCISIYEDYKQRHGKPTAQMLLLCSWRSIKEACLFLGDLVSKLPVKTWIESGLLTEEIIVTIGVELRKLLCEIKHRGAFEHAYVGFTSLVTAFWQCPMKNLNELPQKWLEELLCEIQQPVKDQKIKFCSSRRSAGLPFLVQAIVCSELKCTNSAKIHTLDIAMNTLLAVADDLGTEESIIHSLNILRALFKHALLGEYVAPYVCKGVMIAIKGSRSPAWAIRNSACLLFSALMIRIFGVARDKDVLSKKNRMTAKHFFQRYPELYSFFLNEMELEFNCNVQGFQSTTAVPSPQPHLFLVLLILGRLYSSPVEDKADIDFSEFFPYINASCCNPTFKIRELGARALVPLISSDAFVDALEVRFFTLKSEFGENNQLHGTLFQLKNILLEMCDKEKLFEEPIRERAEKWIENSHMILDLTEHSTPYMVKIIYVQILHLLFKLDTYIGGKIYDLLNEKGIAVNVDDDSKTQGEEIPGYSAYSETVHFVRFDIAAHIWRDSGNKDHMMRSFFSMLESKVEEVQIVGLVFLKYITSTKYDDLPDEEESNLISVKLNDMLCIQDENKFSLIAKEIFSHEGVINHVMESFVTLLNNANEAEYLYKMTTRLKLSVFSNFLLKSLISARDIYDACTPTAVPGPVLDLLSEIIKCHSSEISVGAFICFGVLFFENIKSCNGLEPSTVLYFRRLMFSYSEADADVKQKMAVCEIFNKYYDCFIHDFFKTDNQAMSIWMLPVKLLSDEDPRVRRRMLEMVFKYQDFCRENNRHEGLKWDFDDIYFSLMTGTPYKAQETLVECYISLLDTEDLIHLFVPMVAFMLSAYINCMKSEFTSKQNEDGVFEKGNPNPFCEDMTIGKLLCSKLKQFSAFVRILFSRRLDPTHIDSLKEFFPSIVLVNFPDILLDFCTQIVKVLLEEYPTGDITSMSFMPLYVGELMELWDS